jgi:protein-tyrosine phosphatase
LFLCTGKYYRSRFAEELFNHLAAIAGLSWRARSGTLAIARGAGNIGPLSPYTIQALSDRRIPAVRATQQPRQCVLVDLEAADLIVALEEGEHRPLLSERFHAWADRITYWHVQDVHACRPDEAIASIEREVEALVSAPRKRDRSI